VRKPAQSNGNSVAPSVLDQFTMMNQVDTTVPNFPAFIGGDTQALVNIEYRIPIIGPLQFAPFFDIGSAFNIRSLPDQFERSEFLPNQPLGTNLESAREIATQREIRKATPPESQGGLPPGSGWYPSWATKQSVERRPASPSHSTAYSTTTATAWAVNCGCKCP